MKKHRIFLIKIADPWYDYFEEKDSREQFLKNVVLSVSEGQSAPVLTVY